MKFKFLVTGRVDPRSATAALSRASRLCVAGLVVCGLLAAPAGAQRKFRETYDTRSDVRFELENLSGSVRVEVWNQPRIEVRAEMEKAALIRPTLTNNSLTINVVRDNGVREDMGNINFIVHVPVGSSVALKTKMGNLRVSGVRGDYVRAEVVLEGDIEIVGVDVDHVKVSSMMGNIFFDGNLHGNGNYVLESRQGDINIHVPADSRFQLVASAPVARRIELGPFAQFAPRGGDGRRLNCKVAGGGAMLSITNRHGGIAFR